MTYFTDSKRLQRFEREMKGVPGFERERPEDDFESPKTPDLRVYKFSDKTKCSNSSKEPRNDVDDKSRDNKNYGRKEKADLPMCKAIHKIRESD